MTTIPDYEVEKNVLVLVGINDFDMSKLGEFPEMITKMIKGVKNVKYSF